MTQKRPLISQIAACARNGVIGNDGRMPWHIPEDLKHFKKVTMGSPVIMGRKTFESIGRPLPGRLNIVLTRQEDFCATGCTRASSLTDAIAFAREANPEAERIFIIGGAQIYRASRAMADEVWLTEIDLVCEGDAVIDFPDTTEFARTEIGRLEASDKHPAVVFALYVRRGGAARAQEN